MTTAVTVVPSQKILSAPRRAREKKSSCGGNSLPLPSGPTGLPRLCGFRPARRMRHFNAPHRLPPSLPTILTPRGPPSECFRRVAPRFPARQGADHHQPRTFPSVTVLIFCPPFKGGEKKRLPRCLISPSASQSAPKSFQTFQGRQNKIQNKRCKWSHSSVHAHKIA